MAFRRTVLAAALGCPVALSAIQDSSNDGPVWVHTCIEGTYRGHQKHKEIVWDKAVFDTIVRNFRAHPSYKAGPEGVGVARVVPYDYEHASEIGGANPTQGTIPQLGVPAAGWVLDLQVRQSSDGKCELWALSEFGDTALTQIRSGGYQWTSVAVRLNYPNHVTNEDQGPTLTSIALTNHPFIQGMVPIVASANQWGKAESPEEFLIGIRDIFGLASDATVEEIQSQLTRLVEMFTAEAVPERIAINMEDMVCSLRDLLGLPKLATQDEILGGAETALSGLLSEQGSEIVPSEKNMALSAALTAIAAMVGCLSQEESAILQAVKEVSAKADEVESANASKDSIARLLELFGSKDVTSLMSEAAKTIANAEKLKPTLEALAAAQGALREGAEADAVNEAEVVAASLAHDDDTLAARFRPVILAARMACIGENGIVDQDKLAKFREDHPLEEERKALLTRRVVAGPNGLQLGGAATGYTQPILQTGAAGTAGTTSLVNELNAQEGRNPVEKAQALLLSRRASHKSLPFDEQIGAAGDFVRRLMAGEAVTL
jgi:phage I-like protein